MRFLLTTLDLWTRRRYSHEALGVPDLAVGVDHLLLGRKALAAAAARHAARSQRHHRAENTSHRNTRMRTQTNVSHAQECSCQRWFLWSLLLQDVKVERLQASR